MNKPIFTEKKEKYTYIKPEIENLNATVSPTLKAIFVDTAKNGEKITVLKLFFQISVVAHFSKMLILR